MFKSRADEECSLAGPPSSSGMQDAVSDAPDKTR